MFKLDAITIELITLWLLFYPYLSMLHANDHFHTCKYFICVILNTEVIFHFRKKKQNN